MDAHAHLDLVFAENEGRAIGAWHLAWRERHADGARHVDCPLRNRRHRLEVSSGIGCGAGGLVGVDDAGDAAPLLAFFGGGAGDIVRAEHGRRADFILQHLAGHVEIHPVAAVIAVKAQHALATIGKPDGIHAGADRRPFENVADRAGVEQAFTDITGEERQVTRAAAGDDADLCGGGCGPTYHTTVFAVAGKGRVGRDHAVEHFVDEVLRPVHQLLHGAAPLSSSKPDCR